EHRLAYAIEDARLAMRDGRHEESEGLLREVLAGAERFALTRVRGRARMALGDLRMRTGRVREAIDAYEESMEDDLTGREVGEVVERISRARVLLERMDDGRRTARIFNATAYLCLETDPPRTVEAAAHLDRAEAILMESGSNEDLAYVLTERGRIALLEHRHES